jgi:phospholipid transport system substrate-binding protein
MKAKTYLLTAGLLLAVGSASSAPAIAPLPGTGWQRPMPPGIAAPDAGTMIRKGVDELLQFMNQKPRPTGLKLAAFLEENLASRFDFEYMARMAVGPGFQRLSTERRADLVQRLEQDFLETLTKRLAGYDGQKVRFFRTRQGRGNRSSVVMGIANPGGYPSMLEFRLYLGRDGWKVYDVSANGNSAVTYYRRQLARPRIPMPAYGPRG